MNNEFSSSEFWNEIRKKAIEKFVPIHGHFELTPLCNFDCKMCYVHMDTVQSENLLKFQDWKKIIDGAIANGMIFASLTGGECLTYPYFKEIYLYLQSRGVIINVLTNGYLLNNYTDFFVEHPPRMIQVSVYGNNEEEYFNVTGKKAWKKVSDNITKAINIGLPIAVSVTPNYFMKNPYGIIKKYSAMGVPGNVAEMLLYPRKETKRSIEALKLKSHDSVRIIQEIYEFSKIDLIKECYDENASKQNKAQNTKGITCSAGRSDFTINWKGEMMMCVSIYESFGFPLQEDFSVSWKKTSDAAKNYMMPIECTTCKISKICSHCPASRNSPTNPGHCNTELCMLTTELYQQGIK